MDKPILVSIHVMLSMTMLMLVLSIGGSIMDPNVVVSLITDLGSFGFILYLVHRTQTHTIPKLVSTFVESNEKQREDFKGVLVNERENFERMLNSQQELSGKMHESVSVEIKHLADEIRRTS
jgi:hypothetical protein